jgi:hypothetical protein
MKSGMIVDHKHKQKQFLYETLFFVLNVMLTCDVMCYNFQVKN